MCRLTNSIFDDSEPITTIFDMLADMFTLLCGLMLFDQLRAALSPHLNSPNEMKSQNGSMSWGDPP